MADNIGWVKLHRKLLENAIFYKPDYFQIWVYILLKVNHEDRDIIWNNEKKTIKKGSGIFSQKLISTEFKFEISKVNRILKYLQNENQIEIKTTNKYTEIEVINWEEYQDITKNGNQIETKQKPIRNLLETNKNDNNDNNEEKELFDFSRKLYPGTKKGLDLEFQNFIKKTRDWKDVLPTLSEKIKNQIHIRERKIKLKIFTPEWKHFQTWINQRCWEEESPMPLEVGQSAGVMKGNIQDFYKPKENLY